MSAANLHRYVSVADALRHRKQGRFTTRPILMVMLMLCTAASWAAAATPVYRLAVWPSAAPSPTFALTDGEGRPRTLRDYRGKLVVVIFGFLSCPDVCPTELFKLSLAIKKLGDSSDGIKVLFVTLDPSRDTGPALKNYVTAFDPRFVGLTGSVAQIDRTAADFHVQYARVASGDGYTIDHSTAVYIFDKKGRLRLVGAYSSSADDFTADFKRLATQK